MSPVLAYAKVDLQRKCKKKIFMCHRAVKRVVWPILVVPPFYYRRILIELRTSRAILQQSSSDALDGVRELGRRLEVRLKDAFCCFYCQGGGTLFGTEVEFGLAINCYDATRTGHLELTVGIVWHRVESSKRGSSKQCMIITAERDDVKD